ncbi:MBL fold metallo-hydrolase [Myxococcus sp. K15C18031901]|uniref:MBL fold metallo-hydrolase n=1 Tax=Myxococcus dinghuensis TaxID=2906761 RepID=UPI0020A7A6E1|nr:MBL fold metallo-hydrolase [Myxococcus dinghuensis]MCP3101673.1 MBL fold metallo-hydrolase [Myxococcus dinghuensis]
MLNEVQAGPYTVRGISVGGVYTSLQVPELDVVLDAGIPIRSFAGTERIFLSHAHPDHASGLGSLLGIRRLLGKGAPQLFLPAELESSVKEALQVLGRLHHTSMEVHTVPMLPGDVRPLGHDLHVRAFRTHHPVPSLGYQFIRRVTKLRPEFHDLPPQEIARRRKAGEDIFAAREHLELAYATDSLAKVLETEPGLFDSRVLVIECTFVDPKRSVQDARDRAHLHLDELIAQAERFRNEAIVLMHFSQSLGPQEVRALLDARLPPGLRERVRVLAPDAGRWFG